jgi:hypothetical protein
LDNPAIACCASIFSSNSAHTLEVRQYEEQFPHLQSPLLLDFNAFVRNTLLTRNALRYWVYTLSEGIFVKIYKMILKRHTHIEGKCVSSSAYRVLYRAFLTLLKNLLKTVLISRLLVRNPLLTPLTFMWQAGRPSLCPARNLGSKVGSTSHQHQLAPCPATAFFAIMKPLMRRLYRWSLFLCLKYVN